MRAAYQNPFDFAAERRRPTTLISYAREDERAADKIVDRLLSDGYGVWLDKHCLLPGQTWRSEIKTAVAQVDSLVFLVSRHSTTKTGFVQKELGLAIDAAEERPRGRAFLIPVRLDDAEVPDELAQRHHFDWRERGPLGKLKSALDMCAGDLIVDGRSSRPEVEIMDVDYGARGGELRIDYVLRSGGPAAFVELGASLIGENGREFHSEDYDRRLWLRPGTAVYRRHLPLSSLPRPGTYRLVVSVCHESLKRGARLATGYGDEPLVLTSS